MSKGWFKAHGPELAIIGGFIGLAGAGVWASFATARAVRKLDSIQAQREGKLTFKEKFKIMAPYYIGPMSLAIGSGVSTGFGIHGEIVRTTALVSTAKNLENNLIAHEEAAKEVVGEKKAKDIDKKANEIAGDKDIFKAIDEVIETGRGTTYFRDQYLLGGQIFTGDIQTIRAKYNDIGARLIRGEDRITAKEVIPEVYGFEGPQCLMYQEWNVHERSNIPDIDIDVASEPDSQGRIIHDIRHRNKPMVSVPW